LRTKIARNGNDLIDIIKKLINIISMNKYLWLCAFVALSCNKLPVGEEEMNQRGDFEGQILELQTLNSFTESKKIACGTSSNLVIGKGRGYESRVILKFTFSDTSFEGLDQIKLVARINSSFDNDTLPVGIHILTKSFTEGEATWDKRSHTEGWDSAGGDYEAQPLRSGVIKGDSMVVYFNYIELNRIKASQGIILIPRDSGYTCLYSREGGHAATFQLVKNGEVSVYNATSDCYIINGPMPFYVENWIGSGIASRNFVIFSYDSTLGEKRAIYGELNFRFDSLYSRRDSIEIGVKELNEHASGYDTELGPLIALKHVSVDDTACTIDIVRYVQRMIDFPDSNFGLCLYITPENYDLSTARIADGSFRLKVGYLLPPEPRD
jgi:hypothetical protein